MAFAAHPDRRVPEPFTFNATGRPLQLWHVARTRAWPAWFRGEFFALGMILDDLSIDEASRYYLQVTITPLRMRNGFAEQYTVFIDTHQVFE